jgi:hypothetical protein
MSDSELLIKINADAANAKKAFDDVKEQTEDLENTLNRVALISGAAFAAFTAEIYLSVHAFEEARTQSVALTNALQNQGIFTEELKAKYEGYAKAVQDATGVDDNQIQKAQAIAQAHLGQTEITLDLTKAIVNLGAKTGDLNGAAEKIGLTIGSNVNAFRRQGLQLDATATSAEKMQKVTEFLNGQVGGLAEQMNKADGYSKALATSFDKFQEAIGGRFAPVVEAARVAMIGFFNLFTEHPVLADFAVAAITAGAAVTGIIALVAAGIPIFLSLSAAVAALGVSMSIAFVGIPLLIGVVIGAITLLALNWNQTMAVLKSAATGAVTLITELFGGLGKVLSGALTLDPTKIQEGLNQITASFKKTKDAAVQSYQEITAANKTEGEKQDADKKALADKLAATERQHQANLRAIRTAEIQLLKLQNEHASADIIALKTAEVANLKALDTQKSAQELALLRARQTEIQSLETQQTKEDLEKRKEYNAAKDAVEADFQERGIVLKGKLREQEIAAITAQGKSEEEVDRDIKTAALKKQIDSNNQLLADRKKYGIAVATINQALHSDEVTGATSAANDLVALQNSKNATLKEIGKAAAIEQIVVQTATAAMNIFEGFSSIPYVGYALGVAGAAAAIIYGGERIAEVTGAAEGGLMTGGIPGVDSIPVLAQQGELIAPKKNFEEVVGAVRTQRAGGTDNSEMLQVLKSIDQKTSTPQQTVIQGDVHTDDSYVDALVRKISDAVQYRNAKIFGVTS